MGVTLVRFEPPRVDKIWRVGEIRSGDRPGFALIDLDGVKVEVTLPGPMAYADVIDAAEAERALMSAASLHLAETGP